MIASVNQWRRASALLTKARDILLNSAFIVDVFRLEIITRSNSFMKSAYLRIINQISSTSKKLVISDKRNDDWDSFQLSLI